MAKVERQKLYGTSRLTQKEILHKIVTEQGPLSYVGRKVVSGEFVSATGNRRRTHGAVVLRGNAGDISFTFGEARELNKQHGVQIPREVLNFRPKGPDAEGPVTLRDVW